MYDAAVSFAFVMRRAALSLSLFQCSPRAIWEDYETETSAGVFKVNIMLSVAQSEADMTSERIKAVNDFVNVPCNGCGINEEYVEESLLQQIEPAMNEYNARVKATVVNADIEEILAARKSLQGKLTRLADLYEDGMIDRAEYRQKRDAIREELSQLPAPEQAREVSLPPDWKTMYDQLTKENKREFWHSAIKEVKVYRGHKIAITF